MVIFKNWNDKGLLTHQVRYVDDYLISHIFVPGEFGRNKCVISTSREYIDIACQSRESIDRHFLLRKGDSVLVEMDDGWPRVTVLNRRVGELESNFERSLQKELYSDHPSAMDAYHYYWLKANDAMSPISGKVISEELQTLKVTALRQSHKESHYIDSLFRAKIIRREIADFYQLKNAYMRDELKLFESDTVNLFNKTLVEGILSRINRGSRNSINYIPTFYDNLITIYYGFVLSNELRGRTNLDSLSRLKNYSTLLGRSLLFKHADKLLSSSSVKEGKELLQTFTGDTLLEHWSKYFYLKYNLDQHFNREWSISNSRKDTLSFGSLLLENHGKVLYVDLWASWCLKSVKDELALQKLYNDYQSKGVEIVHISADTEFEKWEWANNKYLSFNRTNSYILSSADVSTVSETFGSSIPRYLLFDQNGNLLHGNAPNPGSEEIRTLFNKYLGAMRY